MVIDFDNFDVGMVFGHYLVCFDSMAGHYLICFDIMAGHYLICFDIMAGLVIP